MLTTERELIAEAIAAFPKEFGLRAFPGDTFRIEEGACYWDCGIIGGEPDHDPGPMLYTYIKRNPDKPMPAFPVERDWLSFSKGTPAELRREVVPVPNSD